MSNSPVTGSKGKPSIFIPIGLLILFGAVVLNLPCPSETQFIYFKLSLAIIASLFGWYMFGFIKVRAKWGNVVITATGSFGLFVLVFFYAPKLGAASGRCAPQYTINLRDSMGRTIKGLQGNLKILIGTNTEQPEIKSDGSVDVKGITEDKETYKFNIELINEDWVFAVNRAKVLDTFFTSERLDLRLVLDERFCCITGVVLDVSNNNAPLPGAKIFIDNRELITGDDGRFNYNVPAALRKKPMGIRIEKPGFLTYEKPVAASQGTDEIIYLHKKQGK